MIRELTISNFKSIDNLKLSLGTVNVLVGENGAGKSNILEALALAGAAHADKLDNEFLIARGVRVTSANLMRSAFAVDTMTQPVILSVLTDKERSWTVKLTHDNKPYSSWQCNIEYGPSGQGFDELKRFLTAYLKHNPDQESQRALLEDIRNQLQAGSEALSSNEGSSRVIPLSISVNTTNDFVFSLTDDDDLASFLIFSPEDSALRAFERQGQIEPLGTRGEGLFKLLEVMAETEPDRLADVQENLHLLGWFERFSINSDSRKTSLDITDLYISQDAGPVDQRSVNEGFLFLAFYFALFTSSLTPRFFALDNIDASLNPRLCRELIKRLASLAKKYGKQAVFTSHNPAILDGMDLNDDEERAQAAVPDHDLVHGKDFIAFLAWYYNLSLDIATGLLRLAIVAESSHICYQPRIGQVEQWVRAA